MGQIALEGMEFFAHHGYYDEERRIGNKYEVDVTLEVDFETAAEQDDLRGTLNYEEIYAVVKNVMENQSKLLEHLASQIIEQLKAKEKDIKYIKVKVAKHNPPIGGLCRKAVITLEG